MMCSSKWIILLSLILTLDFVWGGQGHSRYCESGWILNDRNHKCYSFAPEYPVDFKRAKSSCERYASFMAMPKTQDERNFIGDQLQRIKKLDNVRDYSEDKYTAWLGGKQYPKGSRNIQWHDGNKSYGIFSYQVKDCEDLWDCCAPSLDIIGRVKDSWCRKSLTSVCEKDAVLVDPSAATHSSSNIALTVITLYFTFTFTHNILFA